VKRLVLLTLLGLLITAPAASAGDERPPPGTPIMRIAIHSIHLYAKVVEGDPPGNEDGYYPVHYRSTNWPSEGGTVAISAHHLTHALPGAAGGPFLHIDQLRRKDAIYLTMLPPYGTGTTIYRETGQKIVWCGGNKWTCPPLLRYFVRLSQDKLILTSCIGDGSWARIVWAFKSRR
jgi:hypothetical protein